MALLFLFLLVPRLIAFQLERLEKKPQSNEHIRYRYFRTQREYIWSATDSEEFGSKARTDVNSPVPESTLQVQPTIMRRMPCQAPLRGLQLQ